MQEVIREYPETTGRTYAQPLSGLRVSWGSVLAGTVTTVAVSLILWALALAIVAIAAHPTGASLKGSMTALWVCAMATTIVGGFVGGLVAGYLPGNARPAIAMAHGFLGWALALIISFAFELALARGILATTADAIADDVALQETAGPGAGTLGPNGGTTRQLRPLERGPYAGPGEVTQGPPATRAAVAETGRAALDYVVAGSWSWFGTWLIAGILSVVGAGLGGRRLLRSRDLDYADRDLPGRPIAPLTPSHST
ncbi:MAG TPA: hypothetical protein VIY73_02905 [Polyangiaceae bacterium]